MHASLVTQPCLTHCDPMDCSPPGSYVRGTLQARILEWVAILSSRGSSPPRVWTWVYCIAGFFTIWTTREALLPLYCAVFLSTIAKGQWNPQKDVFLLSFFFFFIGWVWLGSIFPRIPIFMVPGITTMPYSLEEFLKNVWMFLAHS